MIVHGERRGGVFTAKKRRELRSRRQCFAVFVLFVSLCKRPPGVKSTGLIVESRYTMQTFFRYLLSIIVFVSLTTGPLCIDAQCSTEADACCGLEAEEISCIDDSCEDDHG